MVTCHDNYLLSLLLAPHAASYHSLLVPDNISVTVESLQAALHAQNSQPITIDKLLLQFSLETPSSLVASVFPSVLCVVSPTV